MSQINQMIERVALIQAGIAGITSAFPYVPSDPSVLECPFFVNTFKGGASEIFAVTGVQKVECLVDMLLCYAPTWSDLNVQFLQENTLSLADVVWQTFAGKVQLGGDLSFVHDAFCRRWGGPEAVQIGGTTYSALRFTLRVQLLYTQTVTA